jgi:hypothetical protein
MSIPNWFVNTGDNASKAISILLNGKGNGALYWRPSSNFLGFGAGDGNRTHDIQLGKLTFYL